MNLSTVFILIPVHNRRSTTLACLAHLEAIGILSTTHIVVIDDGSTDGTAEAIQTSYPTVELLTGRGDWWWTGAIRQGMAYGIAQGADWLIWLNDDCLPAPATIPTLIEFLQSHPRAIAAPACYLPHASQPEVSGFRGRQRVAASPDQVIEVEGTSGYCVAMPRSVVATIGLPDADRLPHYGGDGIYLLQARRAGYSIYVLGHAQATLVGETNPVYQFAGYVRSLNQPNWKRIFWYRKSPYYLPAQFYYHQIKYGNLLGPLLFLAKFLTWTGKWVIAVLRFLKYAYRRGTRPCAPTDVPH